LIRFYNLQLLLALFFTASQAFATIDRTIIGGRANGIAGAATTLRDEWSFFNNIGGLAGHRQASMGFYYENRFNSQIFNTISAMGVLPNKKNGTYGLGFQRTGNSLFATQMVQFGFSHQINSVSLGVQADYVELVVPDFTTKRTLAFNFGGVAELTPQIIFGATISNFNQARLANYQNENFPTWMRAGVSYKPIKQVLVNIETEKGIGYDPTVRVGVEYRPIEKLALRTGINRQPYQGYAGVGFNHKQFSIDYAISHHPQLGISNYISLSYRFGKRDRQSLVPDSQPDSDK